MSEHARCFPWILARWHYLDEHTLRWSLYRQHWKCSCGHRLRRGNLDLPSILRLWYLHYLGARLPSCKRRNSMRSLRACSPLLLRLRRSSLLQNWCRCPESLCVPESVRRRRYGLHQGTLRFEGRYWLGHILKRTRSFDFYHAQQLHRCHTDSK